MLPTTIPNINYTRCTFEVNFFTTPERRSIGQTHEFGIRSLERTKSGSYKVRGTNCIPFFAHNNLLLLRYFSLRLKFYISGQVKESTACHLPFRYRYHTIFLMPSHSLNLTTNYFKFKFHVTFKMNSNSLK